MKNVFAELIEIANNLDNKGLNVEADRIDSVLKALAKGAPSEKHDITAYYKVSVPTNIYNKFLDPTDIPEKYHKRVVVDVVAAPRSGYNVGEALETKQVKGKTVREVKPKVDNVVDTFRKKYESATVAEQFDFYPV